MAGMFDGIAQRLDENVYAQKRLEDAQNARDAAYRSEQRAQSERAWRHLLHILSGGAPSRDPLTWDAPRRGMLPFVDGRVPPRRELQPLPPSGMTGVRG